MRTWIINTPCFAIIQELIELGADTLVVPGNLPIGCSSSYLTYFQSSNKHDYDMETGCIKWLNEFAKYHNKLLLTEINRIRELNPHALIVYADYYNAAMTLYRSPQKYGTYFCDFSSSFAFFLDFVIITISLCT